MKEFIKMIVAAIIAMGSREEAHQYERENGYCGEVEK
jgi:hypothetical protein